MSPKLLNDIIKNLNNSINNDLNKDEYFNNIINALDIKIIIPPHTKAIKRNYYYYKSIIDYLENEMSDEQRTIFYSNIDSYLVQFIKDDNTKKSILKSSYNKYYQNNDTDIATIHIETLSTIHDDEYKIEFYKENKYRIYSGDIALLIASLDNDNLKTNYLDDNDDLSPKDLATILAGINSDEIKLKYYNKYRLELDTYQEKVIISFNTDDIKMSFLNKYDTLPFDIISTIKNPNNIAKYLPRLSLDDKANLLDYIDDEKIKIKIIKELIPNNYKINLSNYIASLSSDIEKINLVGLAIKNNKKLNPYIITSSIKNPSLKIETLKKYGNAQTVKQIRNNRDLEAIQILNNLDLFLEKELNEEDKTDIDKYKEIIKHMFKTNNDIVFTIDFSILKDDYLSNLGEDKINFIASFKDFQTKILKLSKKEFEIFHNTLNYYISNNNYLDWTYIANLLLESFYWEECKTIINNISNIKDVNIAYLTKILLDGNYFKLTTVDEVNNLPTIIKEKCNEQIKSDNIYDKINAIMIKLCGIGQDTSLMHSYTELRRHNTWHLTELYGHDIDLIENDTYKELINRLKTIQEVKDPSKLDQIYESISEFRNIDILKIETELKKEFLKLYNKTLLQIDDLRENRDGLLEAGTNYSIITTSIGAYIKNSPSNYEKDWNRPSLASQHFCASYIRNDMIGLAPIPHISYGFTHMDEDSLMLSGPNDIYSSGTTFISKAYNNEVYYAPDNQINETHKSHYKYNEMDFRRIQNGIKKQPDYILVFKKNNEIQNLEEAKKASTEWNNLPIVLADIDLCLENEYELLRNMLEEYQETKSSTLLKNIIQKLQNNRVTDSNFAKEIDIDKLFKELNELTNN